MVPTSAHSGDGMGNLMAYVVQHCQTRLAKRLSFSENLQCTVLEVSLKYGFFIVRWCSHVFFNKIKDVAVWFSFDHAENQKPGLLLTIFLSRSLQIKAGALPSVYL